MSEEVSLEDESKDYSTQCHGYSLTKGSVIIENDELGKVLEDDFNLVETPNEANIVVFSAKDNSEGLVVIDPFAHSAVVNQDGTYSDNAGNLATQENVTLDDVKRSFDVVKTSFYKSKGDVEVNVSGGKPIGKKGDVNLYEEKPDVP